MDELQAQFDQLQEDKDTSMDTRTLYRKAYRDARILKYHCPPKVVLSIVAIPLRFKLAARESIEADELHWRGVGYVWVSQARQHHFELLKNPSLQY